MKMPAFTDDEDCFTEISGEQHLVSPMIISYVKWLIYTAVFREPLREQQGAAHLQFYLDWKRTIAAKEDIFCKRLLEALQIWYAKFPSSKKRGRSLLTGRPPDSVERGLLDDPEDDEGLACGACAARAPLLPWAPGAVEPLLPVLPPSPRVLHKCLFVMKS